MFVSLFRRMLYRNCKVVHFVQSAIGLPVRIKTAIYSAGQWCVKMVDDDSSRRLSWKKLWSSRSIKQTDGMAYGT